MRIKTFIAGLAGLFAVSTAGAQAPQAQAPAAPARPLIQAPAMVPAATPDNLWHLDLSTGGRVTIQLRPDVAPLAVERIKTLTRRGFYNNVVFHRVIEGFMAQSGDPTGTGSGGSDLPDVTAEFSTLPHLRGSVAAARTQDPNSANSQFYIMFVPRFSMDGQYTVFGRVVAGMAFVDAIERGEPPINPSRIVRASLGSDNLAPLSPEQLRAAAPAPAASPAVRSGPLDLPVPQGRTPQ
jgi:peptidylprolyl isomerase